MKKKNNKNKRSNHWHSGHPTQRVAANDGEVMCATRWIRSIVASMPGQDAAPIRHQSIEENAWFVCLFFFFCDKYIISCRSAGFALLIPGKVFVSPLSCSF